MAVWNAARVKSGGDLTSRIGPDDPAAMWQGVNHPVRRKAPHVEQGTQARTARSIPQGNIILTRKGTRRILSLIIGRSRRSPGHRRRT